MPLEDLVATIEKPKGRIEKHRPLLVHSEALTRYVLIDPLLRELGWDTEDPERVRPEYPDPSGRPDYALIGNDRPISMVEAKSLGTNLDDTVVRRAMEYCTGQGVKYAIVTNGERWELYNVLQSGTFEERRLLMLSIAGESTHQCALQLLLLWRPNLASGQPVAANEPVFKVGSEEEPSNDDESVQLTPPSEEHWTSLAELQSVTNMTPPSTVRLPDGDERSIERWWNVPFEIAEWHIKTGRLKSDSCPIKIGTTRYLVSASPNHSNGTPFNQARQLSQGLFLDTPYDANGLLNGAKFLIEHCGGDLGTVWLKFL